MRKDKSAPWVLLPLSRGMAWHGKASLSPTHCTRLSIHNDMYEPI
jgi:hypothetical protein